MPSPKFTPQARFSPSAFVLRLGESPKYNFSATGALAAVFRPLNGKERKIEGGKLSLLHNSWEGVGKGVLGFGTCSELLQLLSLKTVMPSHRLFISGQVKHLSLLLGSQCLVHAHLSGTVPLHSKRGVGDISMVFVLVLACIYCGSKQEISMQL
jgi:hypothetical protein